MAHLATNKKSYLTQVAILAGAFGGGLIFAALLYQLIIGLTLGFDVSSKYNPTEIIERFINPSNANTVRITQFILALITLLLPAWIYAKICHVKPATHLGFKHKVKIQQVVIAILIMIAVTPVADALSRLTLSLPFSDATFAKFKAAEDEYAKQISVIGKMDSFPEFLISLFMLAILPSMFEEIFFRGVLQNLFSRWWKKPLLAIIVSSLLFSAVHFSYTLFLSRALLGFALGWMYYRTGNIWLNIIAHAINNAMALVFLYIGVAETEVQTPVWVAPIALFASLGLFIVFERVSKYQIHNPGKEELIEYEDVNRPNWTR